MEASGLEKPTQGRHQGEEALGYSPAVVLGVLQCCSLLRCLSVSSSFSSCSSWCLLESSQRWDVGLVTLMAATCSRLLSWSNSLDPNVCS